MATFRVTERLLTDADPFPELTAAARRPDRIGKSRPARQLLSAARSLDDSYYPLPELPWSLWRDYARTGNRDRGQSPYFLKRRNLAAAVVAQLLDPSPRTLDAACDYLWDICEETTWVLPAHEHGGGLDLFACETGYALAEAAHALAGRLPEEIAQRVAHELEVRLIAPAIRRLGGGKPADLGRRNLMDIHLRVRGDQPYWADGHNNWAGVCASSIGAVMLYVERDRRRLARGLNLVLGVLDRFLANAFAEDGASDEGLGYWQYGLINYVSFAEMLRTRTAGAVDLLAMPRIEQIARYPAAVMLSQGRAYCHADCPSAVRLSPGVYSRLAERTGVDDLRGLLARHVTINAKLPVMLRDLLWWDGNVGRMPKVTSTLLPSAGIWRMKAGPIVLAGKAGHNAESHNHNDVGSFCLHAGGQDLLCDPGAPEYTRDTFSKRRYEVYDQTATRGHGLPLIGGVEQQVGREFAGQVVAFEPSGRPAHVEMEIAGAYPVKGLRSLRRRIELAADGFELTDAFEFAGRGRAVQEAFVTWLPVKVRGRRAVIRGDKYTLTLTLADGPARFKRTVVPIAGKQGNPEGAAAGWKLNRLTVDLPPAKNTTFTLRARLSRSGV